MLPSLLSVEKAYDLVQNNALQLPTVLLPFLNCSGRVLRENIYADRDFPPFNRVMMDGIALDIEHFKPQMLIENTQFAGEPPYMLRAADACVEVMTGAVLPINTNAVVRYEDVDIVQKNGLNIANIRVPAQKKWQNVHLQGQDRQQNDLLLAKGTNLSPAAIALAASVGKTTLQVAALPRIALISTGNELVEVAEKPLPYQIRKSNVYALKTILQTIGIEADIHHFQDDRTAITLGLEKCLAAADVLILSGGVSEGKADYLPVVFEEMGIEKIFHKVAQKAGKPLWFGKSKAGQLIFAFPGNPISSLVCCYRYALPFLKKSIGLPLLPKYAMLNQEIRFEPRLTYFLPVKTYFSPNGQCIAEPCVVNNSGDYANLLGFDAFMELPAEQSVFAKGETYPIYC